MIELFCMLQRISNITYCKVGQNEKKIMDQNIISLQNNKITNEKQSICEMYLNRFKIMKYVQIENNNLMSRGVTFSSCLTETYLMFFTSMHVGIFFVVRQKLT